MGDSNEPEAFMQNYNDAITHYMMLTHERIGKPLTAQARWTGNAAGVDASAGTFVDDVVRIVTATENDPRALTAQCNFDSQQLTNALATKTLQTNRVQGQRRHVRAAIHRSSCPSHRRP